MSDETQAHEVTAEVAEVLAREASLPVTAERLTFSVTLPAGAKLTVRARGNVRLVYEVEPGGGIR